MIKDKNWREWEEYRPFYWLYVGLGTTYIAERKLGMNEEYWFDGNRIHTKYGSIGYEGMTLREAQDLSRSVGIVLGEKPKADSSPQPSLTERRTDEQNGV